MLFKEDCIVNPFSFFRPLALATIACTFIASVAHAQYPDHAIRLVVPYPPGGATDVIGRVMAQKLGVLRVGHRGDERASDRRQT